MFHTLLSKSQIFLVDLAEALLVIHTNRFCVKFFVKKGNFSNNFQTRDYENMHEISDLHHDT